MSSELDEYANAPSLPWEPKSPDTAVDARRTHPSEDSGIAKVAGRAQHKWLVGHYTTNTHAVKEKREEEQSESWEPQTYDVEWLTQNLKLS